MDSESDQALPRPRPKPKLLTPRKRGLSSFSGVAVW